MSQFRLCTLDGFLTLIRLYDSSLVCLVLFKELNNKINLAVSR